MTSNGHHNYPREIAPVCPACGAADLVRILGGPRLRPRTRVRCLRCHHRFTVGPADFAGIRNPDFHELRGASLSERLGYMQDAPMTVGQIVVTGVGIIVGAIVCFWLNLTVLFFVVLFASWWLGRILFPESRRRKLQRLVEQHDYKLCPQCRYSLLGLDDAGRCPECGTPFTLADVRAHWQRLAYAPGDPYWKTH